MSVYHHHPLLLLDRRLVGSQNSTGLTDQHFLFTVLQKSAKYRHVLSITAFVIKIYTAGRRLAVSNVHANCFG